MICQQILSILALAIFSNSVSLWSSAIVKVPEQVGAAKSGFPTGFRGRVSFSKRIPWSSQIRTAQDWEPGSQEEVPKQGFQARFPGAVSQARFPSKRFPGTGSQARVPSKRFPSKVPRNRFPSKVPKQGSQEEVPSKVPKQGSQARLPGTDSQARGMFSGRGPQARFPTGSKQGSQEQVLKQGFPGKGSQARFPGTGSQARFPSKVPRKRFPGKVPRQGFPAGRGFQEQVPKQGSQEQVLQARISGTVFKVSRNRFPSKTKLPEQVLCVKACSVKKLVVSKSFPVSVNKLPCLCVKARVSLCKSFCVYKLLCDKACCV